MDKRKLYKLKSDATLLGPTIQVGKNGVTEALAEEMRRQLKELHLVKVKFLKSATEGATVEQIGQQLAELTKSELIEIRGKSAVYFRR